VNPKQDRNTVSASSLDEVQIVGLHSALRIFFSGAEVQYLAAQVLFVVVLVE
jgi:hypothetical protein